MVSQHQPFIFTFLFENQTPALSSLSFYHSIHHQLGPLQRPLLSSTSPLNVYRRISTGDCAPNTRERVHAPSRSIYHLVYDPSDFTIRSSIPNIPEPGISPGSLPLRDPDPLPWSRVEALNVHNQFLNTYVDTKSRPLEAERTCKTSRGWWLVWIRMPSWSDDAHKEAFLVRKATDSASASRHSRSTSGLKFFRNLSVASTGTSQAAATSGITEPGKPVEGLGFDTRNYVESLLNLSR
jgi:hypothetical protein